MKIDNSAGVTVNSVLFTGGNVVVPKTAGVGIKVDAAGTPTFGWKDLVGQMVVDEAGANAATLASYNAGSIREYRFSVGDKIDLRFHMPHDYVPGTNLYVHVHWSHNGTDISGTFSGTFVHSYAKGYGQAAFTADETVTLEETSLNITNTPKWQHKITEVQLSASGGAGGLLDTDILEVDGIILANFTVNTIPTITGGAAEPFIHMIDIHYQSTQMASRHGWCARPRAVRFTPWY